VEEGSGRAEKGMANDPETEEEGGEHRRGRRRLETPRVEEGSGRGEEGMANDPETEEEV
jgi:hypothetical protein